MRVRRFAKVAAAGTFPGAVLMTAALAGTPAYAAKPPPGDNGDVKIREVVGGEVSEEKHENANNPKVCDFIIEAFNYDPGQVLEWDIVEGPGFKGEPVAEGSFKVNDDGFKRSRIIDELKDGQYKLNVTFDGAKSNDEKHKVFKVDCPDEEEVVQDLGTEGETEDPGTEGEPDDEATAGSRGVEPTVAEETDEMSGVESEAIPAEADDTGEEATGGVDTGGGGMGGPAALPGVLLGGSLLTLGAVAARRARSRG